jgi:hypothetical protein
VKTTPANEREGRRKAALLLRATTADADAYRCPIPGCGRPSQALAGRGLSLYHCRYHIQFKNRHGSLWKSSYRAAELRPYRRAAERYLKANAGEFWIAAALQALRRLMDGAGPVERVSDVLHFLTPPQKARAALARLRRREIPPERMLAIHLAVTGAVAEDPIGPGGPPNEYRLTQIAKAVHRLASGYDGFYGPRSAHERYPRSSGLALRHLGRLIDQCCEHVAREHLNAILTLKAAYADKP